MTQPDRLIIDRGDLVSLVAVCRESDPGRVLLWHPIIGTESGGARMARQHAETLGAPLVETHLGDVGDADCPQSTVSIRWLELVQSMIVARQHGARQILDPIQVGRDVERLGRLAEEVTVLSDLSGLDPDAPGVELDLPFFDLTDVQLVELAMDLGVPFRQFWPCQDTGSSPCGGCAGCDRWRAVLAGAGVVWPWEVAATGRKAGVTA